jgi:N-acetylmuramoyl-L-alanine amidase
MLEFCSSLYLGYPKLNFIHAQFQRLNRFSILDGLERAILVAALAAIAVSLGVPTSAQTYTSVHAPGISVTEVTENLPGGEIVLRADSATVAGRPQFKYLPGDNGDTVLVADFAGLSWNRPTRIIRLNSSENGLINRTGDRARVGDRKNFGGLSGGLFGGLKEIHIGQFQDSPSILRISFIARDPAILKRVAIAAAPGLLKISMGNGINSPKSVPRLAASLADGPKAGVSAGNQLKSAAARASLETAASPKGKSANSSILTAASSPKGNAVNSPKGDAGRSVPVASEPSDNSSDSPATHRGGWLARLKYRTKEMFGLEGATGEQVAQGEGDAPTARDMQSTRDMQSAKDMQSSRDGGSLKDPLSGKELKGAKASREAKGLGESQVAMIGESRKNNLSASSSSSSSSVSNSSSSSSSSSVSNSSSNFSGTAGGAEYLGPVPLVTLDKADDQGSGAKLEIFRVELTDGKSLLYKSFRLHNPERYVLDIPECPQLAGAVLPDISQSPLVSNIRVGVPSENGAGRLVLQLADDTVSVDESFNSGSSYMTVTLGKGLTRGSQSNLGLSSGISPGPIYVPRAPSETVIVLDAGHGGSDPGAMRGDVQEKEITMAIINKLKKVLEAKGARIVLTRSDDTFISLEERVRITNTVQPNLFLSVHINSLESTSDIFGVETYYQTDRSRPLADKVHESLVSGLGVPDRFVRRARFYVINHTPVPAILAEVGYITNKTERDRLISSDYQAKVAGALARGVMLYLQDVKSQGDLANSGAYGQSQSQSPSQTPSKLAASGASRTK